jgi:lysophosphatidylcholine acyltransferase / lyso-PAF acetyltransferase
LQRMFEDLDKNGDDCIDRTEFQGKALNALATMRGIDLPSLPALPNLPDVKTSVGWVQWIVWLQFLFLVALFIIEHVRVVVFDPPFSISTGPVDWNATPPHATIQEALHYDTPLTRYEKFKQMLFLFSGVLFLRIALTVIFFTIGILFVNLSVVGGRSRTANPTWFKLCSFGVRVFGYLGLASMGFYCIRVAGQRASRTETKLLVGNHICMIEVVALFLLANIPSFVSRVENLSLPLFRGLAQASDAVVVDRDAASSRTKTLEAIKKRSTDPQATQLLIFPEGTCSNQLTLFQFKKGAFEPGVPVQLVCFHYPYQHFNPAWTGRACGGNDAWDLLLRMWSQFVNRLEVRFLPVYTPTAEECRDPIAFAKHCQQIIASVVHAGSSEASFANYTEALKRFNKRSVVNAGDSNENTPRSNKKDN